MKPVSRKTLIVVFDISFVIISFLLVSWMIPGKWNGFIPDYYKDFVVFIIIWFSVSLLFNKYNTSKSDPPVTIIKRILFSNFTIAAIVSILFYGLNIYYYSRLLVFGVIILATFFEFILFYIINAIFTSLQIEDENGLFGRYKGKPLIEKLPRPIHPESIAQEKTASASLKNLESIFKLIKEENGADVHDFIRNHLSGVKNSVRIVSTSTRFNIYSLEKEKYGCIVNLQRINDIKRINKFFEAVNAKLYSHALFLGKAETYVSRKKRIMRKFATPVNYIVYSIDFIIKRIWPKFPVVNRLYFFITSGQNRVISRAETLGRLYSCGFEVVEECFINDEFYFVVRKITEPLFPHDPSYGPLIKLNRVGRDGKYFNVFKMRTMHPYAEYLQEYVYKLNDLQPGGKIKDDFRVTTIGKFLRKFWLDELPMLINVLRGEMKIVGVRPLSEHYFNLYTEELKLKRIKHKPGLIPPFYVDMPVTLDEIMASEMRYLELHEKKPFITDFKYFFKALKNILIKHARSK